MNPLYCYHKTNMPFDIICSNSLYFILDLMTSHTSLSSKRNQDQNQIKSRKINKRKRKLK